MSTVYIVRGFRNVLMKNQVRFYTRVTNNLFDANAAFNQKTTSEADASKASSENNEKKDKYYDIVICGSGMVGTAMASLLGKSDLFKNHKIALIESSAERKTYKLSEFHSNRVSALNKSSVDLLKNLDCFDFIEKSRYCKVKQMQVWEACSDSVITFQSEDDLAIIVENDLVQASLDQKIKDYKNVDVLYSTQLKEILKESLNEELIQIRLKDDSTIATKLLIGSDGPNSFIRKQAEFSVTQFDYDQMAIVATLRISPCDNVIAWQRFLPTGPLALLPLNNEYSSLVWSIEKKFAKDLMALSEEEFVNRINNAFVDESNKNAFVTSVDKFLDDSLNFMSSFVKKENFIAEKVRQLPPKVEACVPNTRGFFPLGFCHSNNYVKPRIALIGDAAHRIHPLAGQGVNLGFADVTCLMSKLNENIQTGMDLGSMLHLENYEKQRQRDAYPKIMFIHFLNRLYSNRNSFIQTPVVLARSLGLTLTNRLSFIKNFYIDGAMK